MTLSLEYIRKKVGWCPNADARIWTAAARTDEMNSASSGRDEPPVIAAGWMNRYRNWLLFWALVNIPFSFFLLTLYLPLKGNYVSFFIAGIAIASLVFILNAHRLWRRYNDVRERGYVEEPAMKQKVVSYLVVSVVILLICFEALLFLGLVPGIDFYILPAFLIGLSIIPWYVLLLLILWESGTGCRLYFDRKGKNTSMYAVR